MLERKNKVDINDIKLGSSELENLLEASIEKLIEDNKGQILQVDEFEVSTQRNNEENCFEVFVTIFGFAGSPSFEEYIEHDKTQEIGVQRADFGELTFQIDKENSTILNSNDYLIVYKSC